MDRSEGNTGGSQSGIAGESVSPAVVRTALTRILASEPFAASDRLRNLLRYLVEEALAGRGNRLKGYRIAVEVFNRGEEFDADTDPLVRIQAGRLRRALDRYYAGDGDRDAVRISIPKGGYTPVIQPAAPSGARD